MVGIFQGVAFLCPAAIIKRTKQSAVKLGICPFTCYSRILRSFRCLLYRFQLIRFDLITTPFWELMRILRLIWGKFFRMWWCRFRWLIQFPLNVFFFLFWFTHANFFYFFKFQAHKSKSGMQINSRFKNSGRRRKGCSGVKKRHKIRPKEGGPTYPHDIRVYQVLREVL